MNWDFMASYFKAGPFIKSKFSAYVCGKTAQQDFWSDALLNSNSSANVNQQINGGNSYVTQLNFKNLDGNLIKYYTVTYSTQEGPSFESFIDYREPNLGSVFRVGTVYRNSMWNVGYSQWLNFYSNRMKLYSTFMAELRGENKKVRFDALTYRSFQILQFYIQA